MTIPEPDSLSVDAGVTSVCISPDGRLVTAGSLDKVVRIWDVQTGQLVERLEGHRDPVYSVAFTPDGKGFVSASLDKTLKYWEMGEGGRGSQCTMNFIGHKDYVLSVAVSHDGKWVVSGSKDRGVQFWDANTAVAQCTLQGHKNSGKCLLFPSIFRFSVLYGMTNVLRSAVISVDFSPAGNILATGSGDWTARICTSFLALEGPDSDKPMYPHRELLGAVAAACTPRLKSCITYSVADIIRFRHCSFLSCCPHISRLTADRSPSLMLFVMKSIFLRSWFTFPPTSRPGRMLSAAFAPFLSSDRPISPGVLDVSQAYMSPYHLPLPLTSYRVVVVTISAPISRHMSLLCCPLSVRPCMCTVRFDVAKCVPAAYVYFSVPPIPALSTCRLSSRSCSASYLSTMSIHTAQCPTKIYPSNY